MPWQTLREYCTTPYVHPRYLPPSQTCLYQLFALYDKIGGPNFNGCTFVFGGQISIGTKRNTVPPNLKWERRYEDWWSSYQCVLFSFSSPLIFSHSSFIQRGAIIVNIRLLLLVPVWRPPSRISHHTSIGYFDPKTWMWPFVDIRAVFRSWGRYLWCIDQRIRYSTSGLVIRSAE